MAPAYLRERAHGEKTNESRKKRRAWFPFLWHAHARLPWRYRAPKARSFPSPPFRNVFRFLGKKRVSIAAFSRKKKRSRSKNAGPIDETMWGLWCEQKEIQKKNNATSARNSRLSCSAPLGGNGKVRVVVYEHVAHVRVARPKGAIDGGHDARVPRVNLPTHITAHAL